MLIVVLWINPHEFALFIIFLFSNDQIPSSLTIFPIQSQKNIGEGWINDEVVNFYMSMLQERNSKQRGHRQDIELYFKGYLSP
jgi:hypothetical protein